MLSDEEKILTKKLRYCEQEYEQDGYLSVGKFEAIKEAVNLIEKQSKEIEELKETLKCTQNSWYEDTQKIEEMKKQIDLDNECEIALNSKVMDLEKEIEELKASHITTKNKATNTEKAKIFDVIENSIDTYIEKSKPYWEQIMTKDEMTIEEALTIINDMYQDRYKIMSQKTEKETIVDLSKMDYIKFTNLEWASVRVLREVQSLRHEMEKQSKEIEELKKYEKYYEEMEEVNKKFIAVDKIKAKIEEVKDGTYDAKIVLESLLEKE